MGANLAILVSSFDGYADLWRPYFSAFHRNWPDCPYPVYLLSNYKTYPDPAIRTINAGSVVAWPECIRLALEQIPEEFVFLLLDDLFIVSRVDNERIEQLVAWVAEQRPACLRLLPDQGMVATQFPDIYRLPEGIPYRASTIFSLWRKDVLRDLLKADESIWQFEVFGSRRTDKYPDFYATARPLITYLNGVIRGKWVPRSQKQLIAAGYPVETQARPIFSQSDRLAQWGREIRARALRKMPLQYQRRVRHWFSTTEASAGGKG